MYKHYTYISSKLKIMVIETKTDIRQRRDGSSLKVIHLGGVVFKKNNKITNKKLDMK